MRKSRRILPLTLLTTSFVLLLNACGISNSAYLTGQGSAAVSITLTGPSSVVLGAQSQYAATVTGTSNATVTWTVNGIKGGNSTVGSISSNGLYIAPQSAPQPASVTIAATSVASPSVSKSLPVSLSAPSIINQEGASAVNLTLTGPATLTLGTASQYVATVTGTNNTGVSWSVNGVTGGNTADGIISAAGLYTAPATAPTGGQVTITATSAADPSVSQSMSVTLTSSQVTGGNGGGSIVTLALSGATTVTLGQTAQFTATVTGNSDTAVIWSVNGVTGGDTAVGTISAQGLYTAPGTEPGSASVRITAASKVDPSVSESLVVTLASPQAPGGPSVTLALSGATAVTLGKTAQYTAVVTGNSDTAVTWSVNGVIGGDTAVGTISAKGLYTAPADQPGSGKVTITATSKVDPSVSQNIVVTLVAQPTPPSTVTLVLSGPTSVTLGQSSQYSATVTGSSNTGVIWSVDGAVGGDSSVGTISSTGHYTAPAKAPQSSKVTISATSKADSTVSQSMVVTLVAQSAPPVKITLNLSGASSVTLDTSSQYTATVSGTNNTGVKWTVNGAVGGNATNGTMSGTGLYTAPTTAPQPSTVTITATSAADSTVAKSIVVTLVAPTSPGSRIPANAIASMDLGSLTGWRIKHDPGTPGTAQGSSVYPIAGISSNNAAREFYMTYTAEGGVLFSVTYTRDTTPTHFVYDVQVYIDDPSQLANLEMDVNHVMADGRTVILATQCSGYSGTWEYTTHTGGTFHWNSSNLPCSPKKWAAQTWHHIQIATHRDNNGNGYYDWVCVDGQYSDFQNANGVDSDNLGWAIGDIVLNFQVDGASKASGSNTLYTAPLIVWRW